jgi:hypothetical protein
VIAVGQDLGLHDGHDAVLGEHRSLTSDSFTDSTPNPDANVKQTPDDEHTDVGIANSQPGALRRFKRLTCGQQLDCQQFLFLSPIPLPSGRC